MTKKEIENLLAEGEAGYALELMAAGTPDHEIQRKLVEIGTERQRAAAIVSELAAVRDEGREQNGHPGAGDMAIGALIFFVGIFITVITFSMASGGGTYVVAWGAILFGAIKFFRGMAK